MSKRGQVTIFIILAIIIVVLGVLLYMFYPQIKSTLGFGEENPEVFIENCLKDKILETAKIISLQGGELNPEHYFLYKDNKINYLCYTNKDYELCSVQEPLLKQTIESEIKQEISKDVEVCFNELEESFKSQGYQVNLKKKDFAIELLPKRIIGIFNYSLSLNRADETTTYDEFRIILNNNLYELVSISDSIIGYETALGDVEISTYMDYYRDLKVEKYKQSDGTTIYLLTDTNTEDKFQFASRSLVYPPGY